MRVRRLLWLGFILAAFVPAWAQAPADKPASSATLTFSLDFPGSDPEHYSITVNADGQASYESSAKISPDSDERETYHAEFTFSPRGKSHIFDLVAEAHYFSGKVDSGKKLAFTGAKKLTYKDGQHDGAASYNYSNQPAVQQLTSLFQSVSSTMEFGRHLEYFHRYQKLALDQELKQMETQARGNQLAELQAVHPILQEILDDTSVINVVRARAKFLLEMADNSTVSH
jgi:hypothetical protein